MARGESEIIVTSCQLGMETDTLVFEQGGTETPDGRQLVVTIKDAADGADDGQLDIRGRRQQRGLRGNPCPLSGRVHSGGPT